MWSDLWSDFVGLPAPELTVSQGRFQREVMKYIASQPLLHGLLSHIRPGCIVRVHVENGQLKILVAEAPKDAILFEKTSAYAIKLSPDDPDLTRQSLPGPHYPYTLSPWNETALAFYFTKASQDPNKPTGSSELIPLDYIQLKDLVHNDQILLNSTLTIRPEHLADLLR